MHAPSYLIITSVSGDYRASSAAASWQAGEGCGVLSHTISIVHHTFSTATASGSAASGPLPPPRAGSPRRQGDKCEARGPPDINHDDHKGPGAREPWQSLGDDRGRGEILLYIFCDYTTTPTNLHKPNTTSQLNLAHHILIPMD